MFRRGVTVKRFGVGCISGGPCGLTRGQRVRFGPDSFGFTWLLVPQSGKFFAHLPPF